MDLRTPGPTPCPPEVLAASARQMINHRGPEAADLIRRVEGKLRTVYGTENDVLIISASGTGAMEAAVVNTLSPGERVLSVSIGVFGDRFASIAETYGADVTRIAVEMGHAAEPKAIADAFGGDATYCALLITHNETSTGVTNPIAAIAQEIRGRGDDRLILVDAISSLSALSLPVDALDLDVVLSGSQKGWMAPPGIAMASVSERAWRAWEQATMPRFYFDFGRHRDSQRKGQTPWTPALSVIFALDAGLDLMLAEGLGAVYERHRSVGAYTRKRVREIGLQLFAEESVASDTVTAIRVPEGIAWPALSKELREAHGVVVAGGQGPLSGRIFRIGHMGLVDEDDIERAVAAIEAAVQTVAGVAPAGS